MTKLLVYTLFALATARAGAGPGCPSLEATRPLGLNVPTARAELERLRFEPTRTLRAAGDFDDILTKLLPRGDVEVVLTGEQRLGDDHVRFAHPAYDGLRLGFGSPALATQDIALRATVLHGRRAMTKLELSTGDQTRLDVGFGAGRYRATIASLKATLVFLYDEAGRLERIFAYRRDSAPIGEAGARGTGYHFVVPTPPNQ